MDGTVWFPRDHRISRVEAQPFRVRTTFVLLGVMAATGLVLALAANQNDQLAGFLLRWVVAIGEGGG